MERSILDLKLKDKHRSSDIRHKTELINAGKHAQQLKWKWAGHMIRTTGERWTKLVTTWKGPKGREAGYEKIQQISRIEENFQLSTVTGVTGFGKVVLELLTTCKNLIKHSPSAGTWLAMAGLKKARAQQVECPMDGINTRVMVTTMAADAARFFHKRMCKWF
ncbi:hypothetical protein EVAR_96909_1 [Eumeta japonica]|uniref:Uncharacterized protein n=1 Tax=Eumeta variegata TaxID=151549 RepID=A0A4C1WC05_EUMVA|nr:hypothetical protein EVAR_96909_1 [Eumeta japonica]